VGVGESVISERDFLRQCEIVTSKENGLQRVGVCV
jgi:hypothetical protein